MDILKLLQAAGVPATELVSAHGALEGARQRAKGLLRHKLKVRLLKAGKIASLLAWSDERLRDVRPDLAAWDIAPMINITAHGDNMPWVVRGGIGLPEPGRWLNPDPDSDEYRAAVAVNYWCKGEHPRSEKSRKAWYRRNGGEHEAWARGMPVDLAQGVQIWRAAGVTVYRCGDAWELVAVRKVLGKLHVKTRIGYEIDNVWAESKREQFWFPIPGVELRAPVTWSVLPLWGAPDA